VHPPEKQQPQQYARQSTKVFNDATMTAEPLIARTQKEHHRDEKYHRLCRKQP
jgi:hypothetical protein